MNRKNKKPIRRLTDILTKEVSIVDRAANEREFLIIKNQEVKSVDELLEVLKNIEGSLETIGAGQKKTNKRLDEIEAGNTSDDDEDVSKAGAKYSKMTLSQLRAAKAGILAALAGIDDEDGDGGDDKKPTKKALTNVLTDAIRKGMGVVDKDVKKEVDINTLITGIVKNVLDAQKED